MIYQYISLADFVALVIVGGYGLLCAWWGSRL